MDERGQEQVDKLASQLTGTATLHVLKRREIENYLLDPAALTKFITEKAWRGDRRRLEVSPDEVQAALQEIADGLRDYSIVKRVTARLCGIHRVDRDAIFASLEEQGLTEAATVAISKLEQEVSQLRNQLAELVELATRQVEEGWTQNKMFIAPGHEILDELMKRYGLRFNKDRDTGDLAALIETEQVAQELVRLLASIASS